ncbi:hypothetical protein JCM10213_004051 [Rhodosporidiobolus nylandii]
MEGELPRSGHSYFGVVSSAQEAHAILEASKLGLLPRITRRLTDDERLRFVQPGAVFVWEEEEAGIRRWTDHIKWSPSRVSGAFLTYTEVPSRGEGSLIKQSFSTVDSNGTKMHLIAYTSKASFHSNTLPTASRDPLIQRMLSQRASGRDPREQPDGPTAPAPPPRLPPEPSRPLYTPNAPRYLAGGPGLPTYYAPPSALPPHARQQLHRSQSSSLDRAVHGRTRSLSGADRERPDTAVSEPRPSSSYDSHPYGAAVASHSLPALTQQPPSHCTAEVSSAIPPPLAGSPRPFPYDPLTGASSSRFPPFELPPPLYSSAFSAQSSSPFTAPSAPTASPFGPFARHLPPLEGLPPPANHAGGESPPRFLAMQGTFLDDDDEEEQAGRTESQRQSSVPRQVQRGSEDERQLRLLGRTL